jgi:hypothetical protein
MECDRFAAAMEFGC